MSAERPLGQVSWVKLVRYKPDPCTILTCCKLSKVSTILTWSMSAERPLDAALTHLSSRAVRTETSLRRVLIFFFWSSAPRTHCHKSAFWRLYHGIMATLLLTGPTLLLTGPTEPSGPCKSHLSMDVREIWDICTVREIYRKFVRSGACKVHLGTDFWEIWDTCAVLRDASRKDWLS